MGFYSGLVHSIKVAGLAVLAGVGAFCINYHLYHNVSWDTGDTIYLRKIDGPFANSELVFSYKRNEIILESSDPLWDGSRRYSDSDKNGIFDWVRIESSLLTVGDTGSFNQKEHAQTHPELLKQENIAYQQKLKEFQKEFPLEFQRFGLEDVIRAEP
ncbi:MAG: hypothetical protein AABX64_01150 [Nanoarchaeota archaeon]